MARVFLSHASADKPAVRRIATALSAAGHDPWLDEEEILVGESIPAAIERGLLDSDFVVLCLSKAAAARGWVEAERDATLMQQLREQKERILPVRLEDVAPPYLIAPIAYVDLFPEQAFDQGIARLTRSIEAHRVRHAGTASTASRPDGGVGNAAAISSSAQRSLPPSRPVPAYPDAEIEALSKRAEDIKARRDRLRAAGIGADHLDREYREVRGQLREGGQLRAGIPWATVAICS